MIRLGRQALISLCVVLLTAFTALVLYSVLMRYLFNAAPIWGEEVPKLLFVWLSFLGAGLAYFLGFNIRMTLVVDKFSPQLRRWNDLILHGVVLIMLGVIFWYSLSVLEFAMGGRMFATGWSNVWTYLPLPIGCLLLIANEIWRIARLLRGETPLPGEEGDPRGTGGD